MQQTPIQQSIEKIREEIKKKPNHNLLKYMVQLNTLNLSIHILETILPTEQQYIQQYAEGFAEWISNNQFTMYNYKWTSTKIHYSGCDYTTSELYTKSLTV